VNSTCPVSRNEEGRKGETNGGTLIKEDIGVPLRRLAGKVANCQEGENRKQLNKEAYVQFMVKYCAPEPSFRKWAGRGTRNLRKKRCGYKKVLR